MPEQGAYAHACATADLAPVLLHAAGMRAHAADVTIASAMPEASHTRRTPPHMSGTFVMLMASRPV